MRKVLIVIVVVLIMGTLTGCAAMDEVTSFMANRFDEIPEGMSDSQLSWIIMVEITLVVIFLLLLIFSIAMFSRVKRTESKKRDAANLERVLKMENEMIDRFHRKQGVEPIDLSQLANEVPKSYRAVLIKNKNDVTLEVPEKLPLVLGDKVMLANVLANLVINASKSVKRGMITISASESDDKGFVKVTVSDKGKGFSPDKLGTDSSSGLNVCKTSIEANGGTIAIESKEGNGTQVTFTVPVSAE